MLATIAFFCLFGVSLAEDECICPEIYKPVCGTDRVTYSNNCMAGCAGVAGTDGACTPDVACDCTKEYDPVCGVDGKTYSNECHAQMCAGGPGGNVVKGKCEPQADCFCNRIFQPVCGSDGETYSNACTADCENVKVVSDGECEKKNPGCDRATTCGECTGMDDSCRWQVGQCLGGCLIMDVGCIGGPYGKCPQDASTCAEQKTCGDCTNAACNWQKGECIPSCTFGALGQFIANCYEKARYCPDVSQPIALEALDLDRLLAGLKAVLPADFDKAKLTALFDESILQGLSAHADKVTKSSADETAEYTTSVLSSSKELQSALMSKGVDISSIVDADGNGITDGDSGSIAVSTGAAAVFGLVVAALL